MVLPRQIVSAQDLTNLGGELSTDLTGHNAIQVVAPNVTDEIRRTKQLTGFSVFHRIVTREQGLGSRFVNASCGGCHLQNGKGSLSFNGRNNALDLGSSMVIKVSLKGRERDGGAKKVPGIGTQIQDQRVDGRAKYDIKLKWEYISGKYPDGTRFKLRKPKLSFKIPGIRSSRLRHSLRMSPLLIGLGLLEFIPEETILALSDPTDSNGDGISGKPNYIPDVRTGNFSLGRFGFKASAPTVEQQTVAALLLDMGIKSSLLNGAASAEISDDELDRLTVYQQIPGVPKARNQDDPTVQLGKSLFQSIGCADCHKMTLQTSPDAPVELANQTIHPFTDLLLHDMGPSLSDNRPDYSANGSEWRTTPLWGLGFSEMLANESGISARFMHDGRARSIEEAILWHGGESSRSRTNFKNLPANQRAAVIQFLKSL